MMTENAQLWHDHLWALGGKLKLLKCSYHLFEYEFDDNGISRMKCVPSCNIKLVDQDEGEVVIKAKLIFNPRKNLGHYKSPAGDLRIQFKQTMKKAMVLTDSIVAC